MILNTEARLNYSQGLASYEEGISNDSFFLMINPNPKVAKVAKVVDNWHLSSV